MTSLSPPDHDTSTSLCKQCSNIFSLHYSPYQKDNGTITIPCHYQDEYPEFPALTSSASTGCTTCGLIRNSILNCRLPVEDPSNESEKRWGKSIKIFQCRVDTESHAILSEDAKSPAFATSGCPFRYWFTFEADGNWYRSPSFQINVYADAGSPASIYGKIARSLPAPEPLTAGALDTIKEKIESCLANHLLCHHNKSTFIPSRLIDVSTDLQSSVKLISTDHLPITTKYASLSHVWGDPTSTSSFFTTTRQSLKFVSNGIALKDLPANFRDAVKVARALQLRYLWIDSLCIIQDDSDDWGHESQRMLDTYRCAYVTIVSASAKCVHDGLLVRSNLRSTAINVPYYSPSGKRTGNFYLTPAQDGVEEDTSFRVYIGEPKWITRAWTLQERVMSSRLIYFTNSRLFYQCRSHEWIEGLGSDDEVRCVDPLWLPWQSCESATQKTRVYELWYSILGGYAGRLLTDWGDRLSALSGISSYVASLTEDIYLCGLWLNDLPRGLLWQYENDTEATLKKSIGSPTWSWTSYYESKVGVTYHGPHSQVMSTKFPRCSTIPGASVASGLCDASGMQTASIREFEYFELLNIGFTNSTYPSANSLTIRGRLLKVEGDCIDCALLPWNPDFNALDIYDSEQEGGVWYLFFVNVGDTVTQEYVRFDVYWCLVLESMGEKENQYRRIGMTETREEGLKLGGTPELFKGVEVKVFELV